MEAADARLKIVDVEDPRVVVTIPSGDIERMVIDDEFADAVLFLDHHPKLALLVPGIQAFRPADVALAERSVFHQLAMLVPVPFGGADVTRTLDHQNAYRRRKV